VREARALEVWNGIGAVKLLESDPGNGALLLESLDASRSLKSIPVAEAAKVAGGLIKRLAVQSPSGFRSLRDLAAELEVSLPLRQSQLSNPIPPEWLSWASDRVRKLGTGAGDRLVHGDLHYDNVLAGTREPWLAIDPKPIIGDPEYAVPELMWTRADELSDESDIQDLLSIIVTAGDLRDDLARGWTVVRCVDYWLWGLENGLTEDPKRCERILQALT
jgi:streptomycin 6-kinase